MHTTVPVSSQAAKNGSQWPRVDAGQAEVRRQLAERDGPHAAGRVAPHLGGGELGVPQRDEAQRDEPAPAAAAPLLDHPVVVGLDAEQGELLVLAPQEDLPAEARVVREAQLGLDAVEVHVGEARRRAASSPGASRRR